MVVQSFEAKLRKLSLNEVLFECVLIRNFSKICFFWVHQVPKPQVFRCFFKGINVMPSDAISPRYYPEMVEIVKGSYTCAQNSFVTATLTENFQSCALVDGFLFFFWVTSWDVYLHFELGVHMMNTFLGGLCGMNDLKVITLKLQI